MNEREAVDWELLRADSRARQGFYKALQAEARRAFRSGADLPSVPPNHELTFESGFLIWKGRPVWWSGEGGRPEVAPELEGPGFVSSEPVARPVQPRRHPGFLRWFRPRRRLA